MCLYECVCVCQPNRTANRDVKSSLSFPFYKIPRQGAQSRYRSRVRASCHVDAHSHLSENTSPTPTPSARVLGFQPARGAAEHLITAQQ